MADSKIDTLDVGALERSVNDSATRVSAIWLSFVAFSAYLAAAASNISHRQLFLEDPIKLPTINIDLPLFASAILLPLLFVIYHIYVLIQVVLLARTAQAYNEAIDHAAPEATDSARVRQRLANTLFAQLFAGSPREREGILGWLLRAMTWLTLAIGPVFVLLVFEIRFLPYHSAVVTWTHRGLLIVDMLAILLLWAGAVDVRRDIALRSLVYDWKTAAGAAAVVVVSCTMVSFPGEPSRFWATYLPISQYSEGDVDECRISWLFGLAGVGFDRLVLRGEDFVDDEKLKRIADVATANGQKAYGSERARVFRGRDLRCGRFSGSDLRRVDFSEADLTGAILRGAHLEGATFPGAKLNGAILDGAQLQQAFFGTSSELAEARVARPTSQGDQDDGNVGAAPPDPFDTPLTQAELRKAVLRNAQLRGAHLKGANLEGANLLSAQLQDADLENVNLRGASLHNATLTGASLNGAKLQASSFQLAIMRGVRLDNAQLQGASLQSAHMQGASLDNAKLHGALLYGTYLQGASFRRTELQGAIFRDAKMEGTSFVEAQMQGARFERMQLRYVVIANSYLWGAGPVQCDATHVFEPNLDSIVHVRFIHDNPVPVPAEGKSIDEFIESSLEDVPDTSTGLPNFSKSNLRNELIGRLHAAPAPAWKKCIDDSQTRAEKGFGDLTPRILRYVCGPAADRNQIVGAVLRAWTDGKLSDTPVAKAIAASLLEPDEKCPGALTLSEETKNRLRYVINPGE